MNTSRTETKLKKDLKVKKKGDEVSKLSPTHSEVEEPITLKAIDGEDIQALAIKEDDLKKLVKPKPVVEEKSENILVKKKNQNAFPTIEVKVAKLVPDRPLKPIDVNENLGIIFDKNGDCLPHSILGTVDEYLLESVAHGKQISIPIEPSEIDKPKADLYVKESKSNFRNLAGDNGENALNNWKVKIDERKYIQNSLSKSINRPINDLVMNQADDARANMEIKTLLDRTIPLVENGKGYRLGSEFWNQPHLVGSSENGIYSTLKESEKGNLPPLEQISKPYISRQGFKENQPPVVNYPWDKSRYLQKRLKNLDPLIQELVPHRPDFDLLQVVGQQISDDNIVVNNQIKVSTDTDIFKNDTWTNPMVFDMNKDKTHYLVTEAEDPFAEHPDVIQPPIFGPCVVFGGQTARWSGGDGENIGIVALESRLNFETKAGKRVLATFEIFNIGTTVIYFDWKKLNEFNPFDVVNTDVQRFYFDNRSNVIMPGDLLKLHIVFKSMKGGIFTEKWEFITQPKLLSGASLILTLRGVAIQEDKYKKIRASIEKKLFSKEAEIVAKRMIDLILSGVKTPERSQSPENAYITEEEIFNELNPQFFYDYESVSELKKLYIELDEHGIWDLSINNFKSALMSLDELVDNRKQDLLLKLNSSIANMSFPIYSPNFSNLYSISYNIVCQSIDDISNELFNLKENLNLSALGGEDFPTVDEFNIRYESWKKEFEIFKQVESEKKSRLEKEKNKEKDKDKSGKKGVEKKDEKKKDEKKGSSKTPVPSAKQTRTSREQMSTSRSVSQLQDKIDESSRTPRSNLILSDEQLEFKKIFQEKAYINVYQILCNMADEIETVFNNLEGDTDITDKLSNILNKPMNTVPLNSDYID